MTALGTGAGLVVANRIGASVFVSAGFMAQVMGPSDILLSWVGTLFILLLTALRAVRLDVSALAQNALVVVKLGLVVAFVVFGVIAGAHAVPSWSPPTQDATPLTTFLENQFWVAFAFSGWNAAIYAASEFRDPKRQVPGRDVCRHSRRAAPAASRRGPPVPRQRATAPRSTICTSARGGGDLRVGVVRVPVLRISRRAAAAPRARCARLT